MTIAYDPHAGRGASAYRNAFDGYPAKVAVGMWTLASRQVGRTGDSLALPLGLAAMAAQRAREAATAVQPRVAAAGRRVERMPLLGKRARRGREALAGLLASARARGRSMLAEDGAVAQRFVRTSVDDAVGWARANVVPDVVADVTAMLPAIIDRALPEIRARVLPVLIDDLTTDPRIRQLIAEQGRGALGEAHEHLHTTTAYADDQVESAVRRLLGRAGG